MTHLSIRLPDDITRSLDEEARLTGQNRSTVVREAVEVYLVSQAQARLSADMTAAAQVLADHAHQSQECNVASEGQEDWLASIEAEEGEVPKWWA
ncbi:MAG: ribbon-helix-helix domain-containing protein [Wenzhouxiangella sp.]|nr:ribbon-helix-helix domain-containing protein [Wenzhouxiangella sp.]